MRPFGTTGYVPPLVADPRNFPLEKAQGIAPFPTSFKADIAAVPVFHQEQIPDCVENAITFVKKYHTFKNYNLVPDLSRRFLAALTAQKDVFPLSAGTNVHNALDIAHNVGICESQHFTDDHDLDIDTFAKVSLIPQAAYDNAKEHKIASYAFVTDLTANGLKNAIHQNGVVVVGALINQNWWTKASGVVSWLASDLLPIRPPTTKDSRIDPSLSGHCFVLYGYDEQYFYFLNSFGTEWADKGLGYFGVNEVPFIYEAATIIDLTAEQIQELKDDIQATAKVVATVDPSTIDGQRKLGLAALIAEAIARFLAKLLG